ncbi:hypothetical protein AHAT_38910 [Agarivorans sp. Toyoura001]|uniref:hypothetical protein n=1 Tax=Agarivorans sp. Toyoura001 TaxID=2283141 RepID=UPI0010D40A0A|nr:hypothetical protein [Agarivorans sp. Toyoura001]GDY28001.1 hypothetical protein AHAT_38910 [Agarivorans sp. Toyoura001]
MNLNSQRGITASSAIMFTTLLSMSPVTSANGISNYSGSGSITQGLAKTLASNIFECKNGRSRVAGIGEITDSNGQVWTVPANNNFASGPKAVDLYEECAGVTHKSIADVDETSVPLVIVDPEGDEITGYIFADNYFELYINGVLIAVDSVPFTPFNSSIVKFKVNKPYTIAVKVIDWEENLGLGSENNRGKAYHPGDGGFIASFSDGTVTNANWQAQTFYTSPIYDLTCLQEIKGRRLSENCSTQGTDDGKDAYAVHWPTPQDWMAKGFDAQSWPRATLYTEDEIGVNNKKAYMNFIEKFSGAGASFIWSTNVVLDNKVLLRYQVK